MIHLAVLHNTHLREKEKRKHHRQMANDTLVEDEILVLQSIFNEDFQRVDEQTYDLRLCLHSLPKKIRLTDGEHWSEVSHLPPLTLRLTFIATYPQQAPPIYCLLCDYLSAERLTTLANQMDQMWTPEEVIVYSWCEFLKESMDHLDEENGTSAESDRRFRTEFHRIGSKGVYRQLIEYNRTENIHQFEQSLQTCPIW